MTKVLESCTGCHGSALKIAMLDLSEGYTGRLKDVPATHADIAGGGSGCPSGDKLIDTASPENSWLLKKVSSQQGGCGDPMPQGSGLMGDDLKCVQDYVSCVAGGM
jgi:hypothetical protein